MSGGHGGRDPPISSQPASAMLVHRGQASGCPERGVLSKNVGHHLWGLQRPRDTPEPEGLASGPVHSGWARSAPLRLFPVSNNGEDNISF